MHQYVNGPIFFFGKWIRKKEKEKAEEETEKKEGRPKRRMEMGSHY